jgi:hypothetical protein
MPFRESRPGIIGPVDIETLQKDGRGVGRLGLAPSSCPRRTRDTSAIVRVDVETKSVFPKGA